MEHEAGSAYTVLKERSSELATRIIARIAASLGGIEHVTPEDAVAFHAWARKVLEAIVEFGRTGTIPDAFAAELDERARARAREGRDAGKAITAYAIGGRALVDELAALVQEMPSLRPAVIEIVTKILGAVEGVQSRFIESFEHERAEMERRSGVDEQSFVRDLISGSVAYSILSGRARALNVPPPPYQLCRIWAGRREDDPAMRVAAMRIDTLGDTWHLALANGPELVIICSVKRGFVERSRRFCMAIEEALNLRPTIAVSNPFRGLIRAYDAYREAGAGLLYSMARGRGGVVTAGQALHAKWLSEHPEIRRQIIEESLGDVALKPELLETLIAYVEYGPSAQAVSDRVFAHANTVNYRMNRIREITGRDPRQPVELAELCLALLSLGIDRVIRAEPELFAG